MALQSTTNNQQVVNARLMTELAVQFNIGADIFGKGNRHVESKLGAENMSGDTVMVPITDGGDVFRQLDLSGKDLSVKRDAVPVTVHPYSTAAAVTQEDLALSIKEPEFMAKRVANLALNVQNDAVKCLEGNSLNATVINSTDITNNGGFAGRNALYDLVALCEASKLAGETFGVVHPLVWSKLIAMFQGNYAPADKVGGDLYRNELGELAGIKWSKTQLLKTAVGLNVTTSSGTASFDYATALFNQANYDVQAPMAVPTSPISYAGACVPDANLIADVFPAAGLKLGDLSQPFGLNSANANPIQSTDIFGNPTGKRAVFHLVITAGTLNGVPAVNPGDPIDTITAAVFSAPVFFEGPRTNAYCVDYTPVAAGGGTLANCTPAQILTVGNTYLPPALVWKRDDFLIAAKGLEKYFGSDALTIPTRYKDKGYLPLRGWVWTDPEQSKTLFRVDVLLGMAAYTRTSMNALYIQA